MSAASVQASTTSQKTSPSTRGSWSVATGRRGERGIEEVHPVGDPALAHPCDAQRGERVDLELGVAEGATGIERGLGVGDSRHWVVRPLGLGKRDPASLRGGLVVGKRIGRPLEPAVRRGRVAERGCVLAGDRDRDS